MMVQWFDCSAATCHAPGSHGNSLIRQQARTEGEGREQDRRRTPNNKILGSCLKIEEPSDQNGRTPNNKILGSCLKIEKHTNPKVVAQIQNQTHEVEDGTEEEEALHERIALPEVEMVSSPRVVAPWCRLVQPPLLAAPPRGHLAVPPRAASTASSATSLA
jgi:hypothetical protein